MPLLVWWFGRKERKHKVVRMRALHEYAAAAGTSEREAEACNTRKGSDDQHRKSKVESVLRCCCVCPLLSGLALCALMDDEEKKLMTHIRI